MNSPLTSVRIQQPLQGLRYPATRLEALRHALSHGADTRVVGALRRLPERVYLDVGDLIARVDLPRTRRAA